MGTLVGCLVVLAGFLATRIAPVWLLGGLGIGALTCIIANKPMSGLLLFVFFIPFERLGSYDVAGVTIRPSQVTILLTMALFFINACRKHQLHIPPLPILFPLTGFFIVSLLNLLYAPNLERSLMVLAFILFTTSIALFIPFMLRDEQDIKAVLRFFFASCFIVTVFGIFQFAGDIAGLPPSVTGLRALYTKDILGFPRVQSTALEPLYFANYLLIPLGVLLSLFLMHHHAVRRWYWFVLLGLAAINLALTVARGGYIAFAVMVLVLALFHFPRLFQLRLLALATILLVMTALVVPRFPNTPDIADRAMNFTQHVGNLFSGASYVERVETFTMARRAWREHPVLGIGAGSFGPYDSAHPRVVPADGWQIVNNEYLELLAEHGTVGFILMMAVFTIIIMRSVKAIIRTHDMYIKSVLIGLLAAFIGILIQFNTFSTLYIVHIWFTIGMLIALQNIVLQQHRQHHAHASP